MAVSVVVRVEGLGCRDTDRGLRIHLGLGVREASPLVLVVVDVALLAKAAPREDIAVIAVEAAQVVELSRAAQVQAVAELRCKTRARVTALRARKMRVEVKRTGVCAIDQHDRLEEEALTAALHGIGDRLGKREDRVVPRNAILRTVEAERSNGLTGSIGHCHDGVARFVRLCGAAGLLEFVDDAVTVANDGEPALLIVLRVVAQGLRHVGTLEAVAFVEVLLVIDERTRFEAGSPVAVVLELSDNGPSIGVRREALVHEVVGLRCAGGKGTIGIAGSETGLERCKTLVAVRKRHNGTVGVFQIMVNPEVIAVTELGFLGVRHDSSKGARGRVAAGLGLRQHVHDGVTMGDAAASGLTQDTCAGVAPGKEARSVGAVDGHLRAAIVGCSTDQTTRDATHEVGIGVALLDGKRAVFDSADQAADRSRGAGAACARVADDSGSGTVLDFNRGTATHAANETAGVHTLDPRILLRVHLAVFLREVDLAVLDLECAAHLADQGADIARRVHARACIRAFDVGADELDVAELERTARVHSSEQACAARSRTAVSPLDMEMAQLERLTVVGGNIRILNRLERGDVSVSAVEVRACTTVGVEPVLVLIGNSGGGLREVDRPVLNSLDDRSIRGHRGVVLGDARTLVKVLQVAAIGDVRRAVSGLLRKEAVICSGGRRGLNRLVLGAKREDIDSNVRAVDEFAFVLV